MHLGPLCTARELAQPRPSWGAIFVKAIALVAASRPELRRAYLKFPWPHLYEHPGNVASIAVERMFQEEEAVFFARLSRPEQRGLLEIQQRLRRFKEAPLEQIGCFRHILSLSRWPRPVRRLILWIALNAWGRKRAQYLGTFGLTSYGSLGANALNTPSPLTLTLNYGPIDNGEVDVRLIYDHRVIDGAPAARALADLERVLLGQILNEVRYLQRIEAA
jgi:hypothetical protein